MKNIEWSFPKQVFLSLLVVAVFAGYPLLRYGDSRMMEAAMMGALLTTINVLLGYAAVEFSYGKSMTTFFKYVLGGMGLRMFAMVGILVLLIKVIQVHVAALVASMGILYVIFLTLEILYIQKKVQHKQQSS